MQHEMNNLLHITQGAISLFTFFIFKPSSSVTLCPGGTCSAKLVLSGVSR